MPSNLKLIFFSLCCALYANASAQVYTIPTHFDSTNIPPTPDYSKASSWAALPDRIDNADKTPKGLKNNQDSAAADVFFIYPTSYLNQPNDKYIWNADVNNKKLNEETDGNSILYQSTIFNGSCKVYAPRYRQAHYYIFITKDMHDKQAALEVAYADVKASFEYYLAHYNHGRPIVIASHSQGTIHAARLLKEFFMDKPLQENLVVAYLVGMPVPKDSLPTILPCTQAHQINCFTCWNTFEKKYIPSYYEKGLKNAVCTNPITWTTEEKYVSASQNKGAVVRPFDKVRPKLCDAEVHQGLLWITKPKFPGSALIRTPIYHAGDYNLFYLDVRENVALRVAEYLKTH